MNKQILAFTLIGAVLLSASAILLLQKSPLEQGQFNSQCAKLEMIPPQTHPLIIENYSITNTCATPITVTIDYFASLYDRAREYETQCIEANQTIDVKFEGCYKILTVDQSAC